MWGAQSTPILSAFSRVTADMLISSHWHVGSTESIDRSHFSNSCNSSSALTYEWGALQHRSLLRLAKHTYGSAKMAFGETLMISHFKSSSSSSARHRQIAAHSHSHKPGLCSDPLCYMGNRVVVGRRIRLGRNGGSRCSRTGCYWCKSTGRSPLGLMGDHREGHGGRRWGVPLGGLIGKVS